MALWQARSVEGALRAAHPEIRCEIVVIRTLAEKFPDKEASQIGAGIFTREIDEALLRGEVDIAVHSLKDIPSEVPDGVAIGAVTERESPLDGFISADGTRFEGLPQGSRIGTGSPRRRAQLLLHRSDLEIVPLRGNVATRLRKMAELSLRGIVLAVAGLQRLGEAGRVTQVLGPEILLPAPGQGALAITARSDDAGTLSRISALEHTPTRQAVTAERSYLRRLRGGCQVPAGALALRGPDGELTLTVLLAAPDGSACVRGEMQGPGEEAEELGVRLAEEILDRGGLTILKALGREAP